MAGEKVIGPTGNAIDAPTSYLYRGNDGGNEYLPELSGHYWMNGYAIWRPPVRSFVLTPMEFRRRQRLLEAEAANEVLC